MRPLQLYANQQCNDPWVGSRSMNIIKEGKQRSWDTPEKYNRLITLSGRYLSGLQGCLTPLEGDNVVIVVSRNPGLIITHLVTLPKLNVEKYTHKYIMGASQYP